MNKKTIAVLFGGCSPEYDVSLQSAYGVITHLDRERYSILPLGITRQGAWLRYGGAAEGIRDGSWARHELCVPALISPDRTVHGLLELYADRTVRTRIDAAFPVLHGKNGEDGTVQGLLELAGIPCVGCGVLSSALCMDKDAAHRLAEQSGVRVPRSAVLTAGVSDEELSRRGTEIGYPLFVKPANAGSSFGITRVHEPAELPGAAAAAFAHDRKILLEEAVPGFEVGCAVLGNEELTIGGPDEIELSRGFFDYTEKYTLKTSKIHTAARIDGETAVRIRQTAARLYCALGCSGFARVDLFLTPEKEIIFNEINTIPGFTPHSRYPRMLAAIGMSFGDVLDSLIELAVEP